MTPTAGSSRAGPEDSPRRCRLWCWPGDRALAAGLAAALEESLAGGTVEISVAAAGDAASGGADVLILFAERRTLATSGDALQASDQQLLTALEGARGRRAILISSSSVHPATYRHLGHVAEGEASRRPPQDRIARRWRRLEARAAALSQGADSRRREASAPEESSSRLTVLRPTPLEVAGDHDVFARLLRGPWSAIPAGYDPPLQLLSVGELAASLAAAIAGDLPPGTWHIAPAEVVPLRRALGRAGIRRFPLPTALLRAGLRLRGEEPDAAEGLRYGFTVSDAARRRAMTAARRAPREGETAPLPPATLERSVDDLENDPFSLDRPYIDRLGRGLFRFLHDTWWRVEWRGLEHVPRHGPAVLVANHRGHQPWDGIMMLHRLARDFGRYPRFLIHPALVKFPHLAPYISRCGGIPACRRHGDWVLSQGKLLALFPEGIRGAFLPYGQCHELVRFRPDYARLALRHGVPIVPFVIVGSAEIFPIFAKLDWRWWKRISGWPSLPLTPTLSLVPLPSKWHIQVLPPIDPRDFGGADQADDPAVYGALDAQVRRPMDAALTDLLARRPGIFHGSIFGPRHSGESP